MTSKITESEIEKYTIELLEKQGYQYIYAPSIAPDSEIPERQSFEDVLLIDKLRTAVDRINPSIPADIREDAIKQIQRLIDFKNPENNDFLVVNQFTVHNTSPLGDRGAKFLDSFSTTEDYPVVQLEKKREYTTKPNIREKKSRIINLINIHEVPYV